VNVGDKMLSSNIAYVLFIYKKQNYNSRAAVVIHTSYRCNNTLIVLKVLLNFTLCGLSGTIFTL